jgi:hypothetical protein
LQNKSKQLKREPSNPSPQDYYSDADAVIFLVDAADRTRLEEAKCELDFLLNAESLKDVRGG